MKVYLRELVYLNETQSKASFFDFLNHKFLVYESNVPAAIYSKD